MELLRADPIPPPIFPESGWTYILLNVHPVSCSLWVQLQHCGGLTGICVAAVSQPEAHSMKHPLFGSIRIQSPWGEVFVETELNGVEKVRKMIMKSGKS